VTLAETINKAAHRLSAHGVLNAHLDAEVLLRHVLGRDRAWLLAHFQDTIESDALGAYDRTIDRRAVREPLQYITGNQEFWGLDFMVTQEVLIPRPETEFVVEAAIAAARNLASPVIIDLCTGSGCIAISLANEVPSAQVFASDRSASALDVAVQNARSNGVEGRIRFLCGDLFEPLVKDIIRETADVITANPPYIKDNDLATLQPEVRDFEPEMALIAGPEGTEIAEAIIKQAPTYLKHGGVLIMEMGMGQARVLSSIVAKTGNYRQPEIVKDLAGIERVLVARVR